MIACGTDGPSRTAHDGAESEDQEAREAQAWPYESLSPAERAVIDRGRRMAGWDRVHDAFAAGVRENAQAAARKATERAATGTD